VERAERLARQLLEPVDGASLAAFRTLFGLALCFGTLRFLWSDWIPEFFERPTFFISYHGLDWLGAASPAWITAIYIGLAVTSLFIALGFFYRISTVFFTLGFTYVELIDVTNYLNHYYLVSLIGLLLCVSPLHRTWSLDAWRRPRLAAPPIQRWTLYLLRFQVAVVYIFAGLAKVQPDWLLSAQPLNLWFQARTELPVLGPWLGELWVAYAASWFGALFDLTIVFWLLWKPTRRWAYAVLVSFHLFTGALFNIGLFPYLMIVSATLFFSPGWPRRCLRLRPWSPRSEPASTRIHVWHRGAVVLAAMYCLIQIAVPLRHYAYPGDVLWNEDGMRWSWKVMVREKHGSVTYRVKVLSTDKELQISPLRYLTRRQEREMAGQPDLILRLAKHIATDFAARGHQVEVRADTLVSLNGRRAVPLIDPSLDLTRVDESLAPSNWVLPHPEAPLPQISVSAR